MTSKGRFAFVLAGTLAFVACADDEDLKDTRPTDGDVSDVVGIDVDNDSGDDTGTVDMDADVDSTIDSGTTDTSTPVTDTGMVVTDTGMVTMEIGPLDTGTPVTDTGSVMLDTGSVSTDTGTIAMDTGPFDTGPFDTGTIAMDTGPFDTGPFDTGTMTPETGTLDTGPFDTGTMTPETGALDTGPFDTGSIVMETGAPDTGSGSDGSIGDTDLESAVDEAGAALDGTTKTAFVHSITIDGANDFTAQENFATTSAGYTAYVTWDSAYVYVGYSGADIGGGASNTKWVFVHLDGVTGGATSSETYNTQRQLMPTGFDSDVYFAWKTDDSYRQLKIWNGTTWVTDSVTPVIVSKSGTYVEMAIPLSTLGARTKLGITTYMINEQGGAESTYAGLYSDSFVDGYSATGAPKSVAHWVDAFSGFAPPNDPSRKK